MCVFNYGMYQVTMVNYPKFTFSVRIATRQDNTLSLYLFLICVKGLTLQLSRGKLEKKIHRVAISQGGLRISHSFFEDDNLLFGQASMDEC